MFEPCFSSGAFSLPTDDTIDTKTKARSGV
jgi:hypothetical protein